MLKTKTWTVAWERDLSELVEATYNVPFRLQQAIIDEGAGGQDSIYVIGMDPPLPRGTESYWDGEWKAFDQWKQQTERWGKWDKELDIKRNPGFNLEILWVDMLERELLQDLPLHIHIWW